MSWEITSEIIGLSVSNVIPKKRLINKNVETINYIKHIQF